MRILCLTAALLLNALTSRQVLADELRVADVFGDHAVLQQGVDVPVWGTAEANSNVTVRFAGQTKSTRSTDDGSWRVMFSRLKADTTGQEMIIESDGQRLTLRGLLVGEVWYASGQSNMQMTLGACAKKLTAIREIIDQEADSKIRMLRVGDPDSPEPQTSLQGPAAWRRDNPTERSKFSAVAYLFARKLHQELSVPIGIIEGSWGGKPIEGFIPRTQFMTHDALQPILSLADQDELEALAALKGGVVVRNTAGMPARIFNARVAPITPYALRGFIWYQGESNAGRGEDPRNYRLKMKALVEGWRKAWGDSELPFFFVQLPAFKDEATGWIRLRDEQRRSLAIPNTGMAVTIDLRDSDIHPANKLDVGNRLALWALANTYGKTIAFSGPMFRSAKVEGSAMRVEFDHADDGLMIARKQGLAPARPTPDAELAHFELADDSGLWHAAKAKVEGSTVLVQSNEVKRPTAVRYACSGDPEAANLYNRAGLPASPFCSDLERLPWKDAQ